MGWAVGFDGNWNRDIGYGVPAWCDHPRCSAAIDRGLAYVCGSDPYGGTRGCGLYFCESHLRMRDDPHSDRMVSLCPRCRNYKPPYKAKPDHPEWTRWKLTDESWEEWRTGHPELVAVMREALNA